MMEYFLLLAAIALVTVIGVATFDKDVRNILQSLFRAAAQSIAK